MAGLISQSHLPDYNHMGALGETFHNVWKQCHHLTNDWIINELGVASSDPSFDNGYYVEYGIKKRIPETYNLFREMLGDEFFWPAPQFASDSLDIEWGELKTPIQYTEAPAEYQAQADLEWITEHNWPNPDDKTIPNYDGQLEYELKAYSDGWKDLKSIFYNIQQISYYCDFTLESAELSFVKVADFEKAKIMSKVRKAHKKEWKHLISTQVSPLRWNLKIWTRFNIAESAVIKMRNNFQAGFPQALAQIERLPIAELT